LRILRFFRFSCDYAAKPDAQGLAACVAQKKNLKKLSRERIRQEFLKLISSEKKENLIAILKLLKSKKIAEEIFTEEMDVEAFQRLFELEEDGPRNKCGVTNCSDVATIFLGVTPPSDGVHELEQKLKLAVLFLQKNSDLKIFAKEICATNSEKKYFQFLLTVPQKLDLPSLKQLLTFHDKKLVLDFYCFCCVKKNQQFSAKILQFIRDFSAVNFPLNGEDVMRLGFAGVAVGEAIGAAKKFWAENDFYPNKITLINFLKKRGG
jgi:poly(A) polymerase